MAIKSKKSSKDLQKTDAQSKTMIARKRNLEEVIAYCDEYINELRQVKLNADLGMPGANERYDYYEFGNQAALNVRAVALRLNELGELDIAEPLMAESTWQVHQVPTYSFDEAISLLTTCKNSCRNISEAIPKVGSRVLADAVLEVLSNRPGVGFRGKELLSELSDEVAGDLKKKQVMGDDTWRSTLAKAITDLSSDYHITSRPYRFHGAKH